jgi:hypothetical protein
MILSHLPYGVRSRIQIGWHNQVARAVLETPPIRPSDDGVVLFSMMGTAVLLPYLVAVKSLWRNLRCGRVVILNDGTLTPKDRSLLAHHCGEPEVLELADVDTSGFPRGGTWERLLTILDRRSGEYWIQLDSDTVTTGPIPEVAAAIQARRSFTLLGGDDCPPMALSGGEFARRFYPEGPTSGHIQAQIESRLGAPVATAIPYVRGCSGFAGFAPSTDGRRTAKRVAEAISALIGDDAATAWGTEQVASNFIVANEPAPVMLPHDRYKNYWGEALTSPVPFVHFVGTHRYDRNAYANATRAAIAALRADGTDVSPRIAVQTA